MVWNNNQQTHGAPGENFPSVCVEEDLSLSQNHHNSAVTFILFISPDYAGHKAEIQTT